LIFPPSRQRAAEAQKEIKALKAYMRRQAIKLIRQLAHNPRPPRSKELHGKDNIYRIWLAKKWRIAYEIDEQDEQWVIILRVRLKEEMDYDSL